MSSGWLVNRRPLPRPFIRVTALHPETKVRKKVKQTRKIIISMALLMLTLTVAAQQRGKATYYSKRATGMRMSDGSIHHHDSLVCAHRKYPFGTRLKVTNLSNGKQVIVRVADRGPFGRGRIIDLSYSAARKLGMLSQGVAMVKVEVYNAPSKYPYKRDDKIDLPEIDYEVTEPDGALLGKDKQDKQKKLRQQAKASQRKAKGMDGKRKRH